MKYRYNELISSREVFNSNPNFARKFSHYPDFRLENLASEKKLSSVLMKFMSSQLGSDASVIPEVRTVCLFNRFVLKFSHLVFAVIYSEY